MWTNYAVMGKYETGLVTVAYQKPRVRAFYYKHWNIFINQILSFSNSLVCNIKLKEPVTKQGLDYRLHVQETSILMV
jgi:hypothetical protein